MRKEKTEHSARLPFAASMLIFGTIGLLRRFIDLPSGVIACFRGLLGCVLLLLLQRLGGKKPGLAAIWKSLLPLLISGGMIGFNWMLLFEAYRYTSIAVATLCYYTAPVMRSWPRRSSSTSGSRGGSSSVWGWLRAAWCSSRACWTAARCRTER